VIFAWAALAQSPPSLTVADARRKYELLGELDEKGQFEEALALVEKLVTERGEVYDWLFLGIYLGKLGRYTEALESLDRALEIDPKDAVVWFNRGLALDELKRYKEGLASYDRALEIDPTYAATWNNRGITLLELGRYQEALESFERASSVAPDQLIVWKGYLDILEKITDANKLRNRQEVLRNLIRLTSGGEQRQYSFMLVNFLEDSKKFREAAELVSSLMSKEESDDVHLSKRLKGLWTSWEAEEIKIRKRRQYVP
jgi:tetratricopeptide (TPR) repeat protein